MKPGILLFALILLVSGISAQKVGVMTDDPQAVLHVYSPGLTYHPDGLLMLGNQLQAHMVGDVNYLQSIVDGGPLSMHLQPQGGNLGINVPLNSLPTSPLHVYSDGVNLESDGLGMYGNKLAGHLRLDFDRIQVMDNLDPEKLYLQPEGGDLDVAQGTLVVDHSLGTVGIGDMYPDASLDIISNGNTAATRALQIRSSTYGNLFNVRDDGHVGIGTSAPNYDLHVIGNIGVTSKLMHATDNDTYLQFLTDKITFNAGGREMIDLTESDVQDVIYLGDGSDIDLNVRGNSLHVNGASGYVGIGTATPSANLDVNGNMDVNGIVDINGEVRISQKLTHTNDSDTYIQLTTDHFELFTGNRRMLNVYEGGTDYVDIASGTMWVNHTGGTVGIGTSAAGAALHVVQNTPWDGGIILENEFDVEWRALNDPNGYLVLYRNDSWRGTFHHTTGDYNSASDRRLKKNVADLGGVLDKIERLSPKKYHFRTQEDTEGKHIGFIAQEVREVFPETVTYNEGDDLYGLDYNDFGVISIQAIKELTSLVKMQQAEIEALRSEVNRMSAEMRQK